MSSEIKVDTISEKTSANGVTIDGLTIKDGNILGDVALAGTTPTFTVGDGGAEDAALIFDGNELDYYIALDDSANNLIIGSGSTVGSNSLITIDSDGDFTLDSTGDIILDADDAQVIFKDAGTTIGGFNNSSSDLNVFAHVQDKDIVFTGDDGGLTITALTLDMSDAGTAIFNHDIKLGDNGKAVFGAGDDLQIYHDGSDSFIKDAGTGTLKIQGASSIDLVNGDNTEYLAQFKHNGSVDLYYDSSKKLETTSTGVDVTGTASADILMTADNNTDDTNKEGHFITRQYDSGTETEGFQILQTFANSSENRLDLGGASSVYNAVTSIGFHTAANTTTRTGTERLNIDTSGNVIVKGSNADLTFSSSGNNITFARNSNNYISAAGGTSSNLVLGGQNRVVVETASTERVRIDSSGNVGIGTTSPSTKLDVVGNATITTADNTDTLTLTSTDADDAIGANLRIYRNSASPANADNLGTIDFEGRNNNSQDVVYAQIISQINDVTDGAEDGILSLKAMIAGTSREGIRISDGGVVVNELSQDIDFRVESNGDTHAIFVDAGNGRVHMFNSDGNKGKLCVEGPDTAGATACYGLKRGSLTGTLGMSSTGDLTIVSDSNEVRAQDSAGNSTIISPHNFEMIPEGASEELAWAYYSRRGDNEEDYDNTKYLNVDMAKVVRSLENLTGEKFIYTGIGNTDDGSSVTENKLKALEDRIKALEDA